MKKLSVVLLLLSSAFVCASNVADIDGSGRVDFKDYAKFADHYLGDTAGAEPLVVLLTEDFENGWANATGGTYPGTLQGDGALTNGWWIRDAWRFKVTDQSSNTVYDPIAGSMVTNVSWVPAGKSLSDDLTYSTAAELSVKISMSDFDNHPYIWLSDPNRNGYGIKCTRKIGGRPVMARIFKYSDCNQPWGDTDTSNWFNRDGEGPEVDSSTDPAGYVAVSGVSEDWVTLRLRLEQSAPGQPITMTLWHTGGNLPDSSYENPDNVVIDDGTGSIFSADVINIEKITHVGMTFYGVASPVMFVDDVEIKANNLLKDVFIENFDTFTNNEYNDLLVPGSMTLPFTNGWWIKDAQIYRANNFGGDHGTVFERIGTVPPARANFTVAPGGKGLGATFNAASAVELSFDVYMTDFQNHPCIWLSDGKYNGYGIKCTRRIGNRSVMARFVKLAGSGRNWGEGEPNWTNSWPLEGVDTEGPNGFVQISGSTELQSPIWVRVHMRLEQDGPGQPIIMTLWHTGGNEADTSYANPEMVVVENGSGNVFATQSIIDISTINHVGMTFYGSLNIPPAGGVLVMMVDNLKVRADSFSTGNDPNTVTQIDDFETGWVNDSNGTIGGPFAQTNGWTIHNAHMFTITQNGEENDYLFQQPPANVSSEHTAGKAHGVSLDGVEWAEVSFKMGQQGWPTRGFVWLSDENQNGYGVQVYRLNYNKAGIVKFAGNSTPFGQAAAWLKKNNDPCEPPFGLDYDDTVTSSLHNIDFMTFHLRLEQPLVENEMGLRPVSMKMWYEGSNILDTTNTEPAMVKIDDGYGGQFPEAPTVIDISDLTYIGFTSAGHDVEDSDEYWWLDDISLKVQIPQYDAADINFDHAVDILDLKVLAEQWLWTE